MKLRASLLAALLAKSGEARGHNPCSIDDLSLITRGGWSCERDGDFIKTQSGDQVTADTKCSVSCDEDHYIMRPGVANYVRCRGMYYLVFVP